MGKAGHVNLLWLSERCQKTARTALDTLKRTTGAAILAREKSGRLGREQG